MRRAVIGMTAMVWLVMAGSAWPQMMHGAQERMMGGQHMMNQGMMDNMGMMSNLMGQMHQMMRQGNLNPQQQREMLDMMNRLGGMMQEMSRPETEATQARQHHRLEQMQRRLERMKGESHQR
jgi:hypothetical protein